jgi:hypothetical protein
MSAMARIVVLGGTGQIGSKVTSRLRSLGHDVAPASPSTGVDLLTSEGLTAALDGADAVVDTSKPHEADPAALEAYFLGAIPRCLRAEADAAVGHHLTLSIVGSHRATDIPFYRTKSAMEQIVRDCPVPSTILHATQFFEFAPTIADVSTRDGRVVLPGASTRPVSGGEVADRVVELLLEALDGPVRTTPDALDTPGGDAPGCAYGPDQEPEIAGPELLPLDEFVRRVLAHRRDPRPVVRDDTAPYFGGHLGTDDLLPRPTAAQGRARLEDWLT